MSAVTDLAAAIEAVIVNLDLGEASARKSGRRADLPYVPIIRLPKLADGEAGLAQTKQIVGVAYATRAEAVARAQRAIDAERARLATKLAEPPYRALREHYGLPRELP